LKWKSKTANLIDGHVHLHRCFSFDTFFNAAHHNFKNAAEQQRIGKGWRAFLLLTETANDDCFKRLCQSGSIETKTLKHWAIEKTPDERALLVVNSEGNQLVLVSGRQIVTSEKIEVLWIGTTRFVQDGVPAQHLIDDISTSEGIAIIPWGPGKWFGSRGKIVKDIVSNNKSDKLYLGDNGNRPKFWPTPALIKNAREQGVATLPGSDPLPLPTEADRAGKFGFTLDGTVSSTHPVSDLLEQIKNQKTELSSYGALETTGRFFRNQVSMQLIKKGILKI
jgi:hypothetical protein